MNKYLLIIGTSFPLKGGSTRITEYCSRIFSQNDIKTIRFSYNDVLNLKKSKNLKPIVGINPFLKIISLILIMIRVLTLAKKNKSSILRGKRRFI